MITISSKNNSDNSYFRFNYVNLTQDNWGFWNGAQIGPILNEKHESSLFTAQAENSFKVTSPCWGWMPLCALAEWQLSVIYERSQVLEGVCTPENRMVRGCRRRKRRLLVFSFLAFLLRYDFFAVLNVPPMFGSCFVFWASSQSVSQVYGVY